MAFGASNSSGRTDVSAYVQALVDYADQIDDITPFEKERDALWARIIGDESGKAGTSLIASTVNGKYFGWQSTITVEEKFRAFVTAIRLWNDGTGSSPITFVDYSGAGDRAFGPVGPNH